LILPDPLVSPAACAAAAPPGEHGTPTQETATPMNATHFPMRLSLAVDVFEMTTSSEFVDAARE